jgi:hypothetical protein
MSAMLSHECVSCAFFCKCILKGEDPFFPAGFLSRWLLFCSRCERIWMVQRKPLRVTREMNKSCVVLLGAAADARTWLGRCPGCQTEVEVQRTVEKGGLPTIRNSDARSGSCVSRVLGKIPYDPGP